MFQFCTSYVMFELLLLLDFNQKATFTVTFWCMLSCVNQNLDQNDKKYFEFSCAPYDMFEPLLLLICTSFFANGEILLSTV